MKAKDTDIPLKYLNECFILRHSGTLIWRKRPRSHFETDREFARWNARYSGTEAGTLSNSGYNRVQIDRRLVLTHRVLWAMVNGAWPSYQIDHVDINRTNNRLNNLREAPDRSSQMQNRKRLKNNTSGYTGVTYHTGGPGRRPGWQAKISVNGQRLNLGRFSTPEAAYDAYLGARRKFHQFQPEPRE